MNLRRILQGFILFLCVAFYSNNVQAQAQLAAVNQDGLIQVGANHPFVVDTYEFSLDPLNVSSAQGANNALKPYIDEGFTFSYDFGTNMASMNVDVSKMYDIQSVPVSSFNEKLKMIHRIRK